MVPIFEQGQQGHGKPSKCHLQSSTPGASLEAHIAVKHEESSTVASLI